jgi:N6-adenosine-specific RNA methylase IME4
MKSRFRPNVLFASARRHSQKPECSYSLIEDVSFGPYLEIFGRSDRDGWRVIGNEVDGLDIRESIQRVIDE